MIEARDLTKFYGPKAAVDHLTFTVEPGRVTGFLGPNGAGKSTTMRLILGLDRPQTGIALINGRRYRDLRDPLRTVGALLEAKSVHPGRTARNHLLFLAQTQGLPAHRVEEVLALVGLQDVADKRAGSFSLGMSQRLGVAVAMLGDTGLESSRIGELAAPASIVLHELTPLASLEGAFMELTSGSVEFGVPGRDPVNAGQDPANAGQDPANAGQDPANAGQGRAR